MTVAPDRRLKNLRKIADLRRRIAALERGRADRPAARGDASAGALGPLRLAPGALHAFAPADWRDAPALNGLALIAAGRIAAAGGKPLAWIAEAGLFSEHGRLYGCGLARFGVDPAALFCIHPSTVQDALWAAEEAAGTAGLGAALVEMTRPRTALTLAVTRRLQLAAERAGVTLIVMGDVMNASAARTRWRISAAPSAMNVADAAAPGALRWRIELERSRNGERGAWVVEWDDATQSLRTVRAAAADHGGTAAVLADRAAPWPRPQWRGAASDLQQSA